MSTMYMAVHEAAHAVVAVRLGGFAEMITMLPSAGREAGCAVSWPADGQDRTHERLLVAAAGAAAVEIYKRCSQDEAVWQTGVNDWRVMESLGDTSHGVFREARALCRRYWRDILNVAEEARHTDFLFEADITEILKDRSTSDRHIGSPYVPACREAA